MRVGIIAEGRADLAVLANIVRGQLGIDRQDIQPLRPEYDLDATDLHALAPEQFSNWCHVRDECRSLQRIDDFLHSPLDDELLVVIQIDTAEAELSGYEVTRPENTKDDAYATELCRRVAETLDEWLAGRKSKQICYAIAVEETDAWVLTLYPGASAKKPTSVHRNASSGASGKRRLIRIMTS
jgi:hypothetical protein